MSLILSRQVKMLKEHEFPTQYSIKFRDTEGHETQKITNHIVVNMNITPTVTRTIDMIFPENYPWSVPKVVISAPENSYHILLEGGNKLSMCNYQVAINLRQILLNCYLICLELESEQNRPNFFGAVRELLPGTMY